MWKSRVDNTGKVFEIQLVSRRALQALEKSALENGVSNPYSIGSFFNNPRKIFITLPSSMSLGTDIIPTLPVDPWVYIFHDARETILYIGKAKNLRNRVKQYFAPGSLRKQDMLLKATRLEFLITTSESEALYLEDNLIKKHQPEYNRLLKGDNSYTYIRLSKADFPQVTLTRDRRNDGATYIGPKHNNFMLRKLLQYLRMIFKFRTSKSTLFNTGTLDSDFLFGLDGGRSVYAKLKGYDVSDYDDLPRVQKARKLGLVVDQPYEYYVAEYRKIMKMLTNFFNGNTKPVLTSLKDQIDTAIDKQHFEWAARLRDIYYSLDGFTEQQKVILDTTITASMAKIKHMDDRYILILATFFEWKLIDVVRQKYRSHETDASQILSSLSAELSQDLFVYTTDQNFAPLVEIENYEDAATTGIMAVSKGFKYIKKSQLVDINGLLDGFLEAYIAGTSFEQESVMSALLESLQSRYSLKRLPTRMECLDISHLSGWWISGGLSCFVTGLPYKNGYRKYKIRSFGENLDNYSDDYLSLKEVTVRRFKKTNELPDLFVLDGGKWQLNVIKKLVESEPWFREIREKIDFVSLGKGAARKRSWKNSGEVETIYWLDKGLKIQSHDLVYDQADLLFVKLRDESHRFANKYRKEQMSKQWI